MRLLRIALAGLIFVLATAQTPPGFTPKVVKVPGLQMTGLGNQLPTPPAPAPFTPKKILVPKLTMKGLS